MCNITITSSAPSNAHGTNTLVVKASAGTAYRIQGFNTSASPRWAHVFDSASLPSSGDAPLLCVPVAAHAAFVIDFGCAGRAFANGIVVASSDIDFEYDAATGLTIDAQYE